MNSSSFWLYDEKYEKQGGVYWDFVNASDDELDNSDLYYRDIYDVIKNVSDVDLKEKMKNKLLYLIKKNGLFHNGGEGCLKKDLFTIGEIKDVLENDVFFDKLVNIVKEDRVLYYFPDISSFIYRFFELDDFDFLFNNIKRIIDIVKNSNDFEKYITMIIETTEYNVKLYNCLIKDYLELLPDFYKNYIKINNDKNYIFSKAKEYELSGERIGIDPNISIGPEIETNNPYGLFFRLCEQYGYEYYGYVHRDATVPNGIEISCNPFKDNVSDIAKFHALCDSLSEMGYYYDENSYNASGQINLGLDYLDSKESILNFYEIFGNCEELLFYISNEEGQLFRQDVYINSRIKPISEIIGSRVIDENMTRSDLIKLLRTNRGGDNLIKGLLYKKNTVCLRGAGDTLRFEFRIPNGGNNFKTWKDNIRLYGKIMEVSKKLADALKKDYLTDEEQRLLRLKFDLQDKSLSLEEKLVILMDLLSFDNDIRQIYYDRYISVINKIKETGSLKYNDSNQRYEPAFDEVEFLEQYNSNLEGEPDVLYDPFNDTYTEKRHR